MLPQPYIEPVRSYFHCWQRQRYWRAQAGQIRSAGQVESRGLSQASSVVFQQAKIGRQRYLLLTAAGQMNYLAWALQQCRRPQSVFCLQLSSCFLTLAWDDTVLLAYVFTDSPPEFLLRNLAQRQGFQPRVYFYSPAAALSVDRQEAAGSQGQVDKQEQTHKQEQASRHEQPDKQEQTYRQEQISNLGQLLADYFVSPCDVVRLASEPSAVSGRRSAFNAECRWQAHVGRSRKVVVSVLLLVVLCIGMSTVWWLVTVLTPVGAGAVGTDAVETDAVATEGNVLTAVDSGTGLGVQVFPALFLLPEWLKEQEWQTYHIELQQGGGLPKLLVTNSSEQGWLRAFELEHLPAHEFATGVLPTLLSEWLPDFELQQQGNDFTVRFREAWLEDLATFAFLAFTHGFAVTAIDVRGNEGYVSGEIRFWAKVGS